MKRSLLALMIVLAIAAVAISSFAQDQATTKGTIVAPASTRGLPGLKVRTPLYIFIPDVKPDNNPPPSAETPSSMACIYGVTPPTNGCPRNGTLVASGGSRAIAVVDYGHNSTLQADFNAFSTACPPRLYSSSAIAAPAPAPIILAGMLRQHLTLSIPTLWRPTPRSSLPSFAMTHLTA